MTTEEARSLNSRLPAIFRRVDPAVATAFALAVTLPSAGNIGGGGFMVIRPALGQPVTIDYRERAPLKSTQPSIETCGAALTTGRASSRRPATASGSFVIVLLPGTRRRP